MKVVSSFEGPLGSSFFSGSFYKRNRPIIEDSFRTIPSGNFCRLAEPATYLCPPAIAAHASWCSCPSPHCPRAVAVRRWVRRMHKHEDKQSSSFSFAREPGPYAPGHGFSTGAPNTPVLAEVRGLHAAHLAAGLQDADHRRWAFQRDGDEQQMMAPWHGTQTWD